MKRIFFIAGLLILAGILNLYSQPPYQSQYQYQPQTPQWQPVTAPVEVFGRGFIQVIGTSESGQTRYRAIRSATVVAQRDILEVLQGISIYSNTTIRDGMLQSDNIKSTVQGFLKGAVKCGERYHPESGYAEVCMRLYLKGNGGLYSVLIPLLQKENMFPQGRPFMPQNISSPQQMGQNSTSMPYDGLIIDVRDFTFRPALVNRILTEKGEVLFDPSKVVSSVLVERGCGGFTNNLDKAKALLSTWGAKNPMYVKASGVVKLTDVKVSEKEATAIFASNQKTQFLNQARVVFLLK